MKKNIKLKTSLMNQDNSTFWASPELKTKSAKLEVICVFVVFLIVAIIMFDEVYAGNEIICWIQICLILINVFSAMFCYIASKIDIYKTENIYKSIKYEYWREILEETSSGVLSYIYNKKINYIDILISTLLKLEKEKFIQINYFDNNIKILSQNILRLSEYEKYVLEIFDLESENGIVDFLKLGEIIVNENFKINIVELIKKDAKEKGYYKTKNLNSNFIAYTTIFINAVMLIVLIFFQKSEELLVVFVGLMINFFLIYLAQKKFYIRTKKGKLISAKLNGLKKYIIEYSNINDKRVEEIVLWDYYIIYAIIFNLKGNLNKDVNKLYDYFSSKTNKGSDINE